MLVNVLKSKIHRVTVTEANLDYIGSITIDEALMEAANIIENEQVDIYDITSGERFHTYAIKWTHQNITTYVDGKVQLSYDNRDKGRDDWQELMTHPDIEIAALCDVDENYLNAARKWFPHAHVYRDFRELFAAEAGRIDSCNISIPDHSHVVAADLAFDRL